MKDLIISNKENIVLKEIRNSIINFGRSPSLRDLMKLLNYRSPRSVSLLIDKLIAKGILRRNQTGLLQIIKDIDDKSNIKTIDVPLLGIASCGMPIFVEENIQAVFPVSTKLALPSHKYFLLKVQGDSMNKKDINDGNFLLVRQQPTAKNGDTIVALVDNEVTIKEFFKSDNAVILKPRSSNNVHKPIVVENELQVQGVVVNILPNLEK